MTLAWNALGRDAKGSGAGALTHPIDPIESTIEPPVMDLVAVAAVTHITKINMRRRIGGGQKVGARSHPWCPMGAFSPKIKMQSPIPS